MPRKLDPKKAAARSLRCLIRLQSDANPRVRLAAARAAGDLAARMQDSEIDATLSRIESQLGEHVAKIQSEGAS